MKPLLIIGAIIRALVTYRKTRQLRAQHRTWDRSTPSLHLVRERHYERLNRIIHGGDE